MCVSIIVPVFNAESFIGETLRSVTTQCWNDWELILVDDGSVDRSLEIITEFANQRTNVKVVSGPNGGESAARNRGLEISDPDREYVIFLDHDDVWHRQALAVLIDRFRAYPDASAVHAVATMIDECGKPIMANFLETWCRRRKKLIGNSLKDCEPGDSTDLSTMAYHICVATMGVCLFKRSVLPNIPFPIQMKTGGADYHLYLRILRDGYFEFIDDVILNKRKHRSNITNDHAASLRSLQSAAVSVWSMETTSANAKRTIARCYAIRHMEDLRSELKTLLYSIIRLKRSSAKVSLRAVSILWRQRTLDCLVRKGV